MVIPAHRIKEKIKWTNISILGCQICLKLVQGFWKRILNVTNVFSVFLYDHSLIKGVAPHLASSKRPDFPLPKGVLCQVWLKMAQGSVYFRYFSIIFPWKREGTPLRLNKRDTLCFTLTKFGRNLPSGHEEDFQITSMFFLFFLPILYPLWNEFGLSFEQTWISDTQGFFVPNFVQLC